MKKTLAFLIAALVLCLAVGCRQNDTPIQTEAPADMPTEAPTEEPTAEPTEEPKELTDADRAKIMADLNVPGRSLIDRAFELADEEQKTQLEEVKEKYHGLSDWYKKEIYLIMGALAPDTPILTREKAEEILADIHPTDDMWADEYEAEVKARFNEYAGAPDYDGGSGMSTAYYFADPDHETMIKIQLGLVSYVDADGVKTKLAAHPEEWDYRDKILGN